MKGIKILAVFTLVGMLALTGSCAKSGAIEPGETAPDFSLKDLEGKTVSLSDFKGKAIVLNFFATWCPPCREEIPDFMNLQNSYAPKGVTIIGVATSVGLAEVKDFAKKTGINYPVLMDDGKVSDIYGPIRAIPTTFIITRDLKIAKVYIGAKSKEVFENDIKELLK